MIEDPEQEIRLLKQQLFAARNSVFTEGLARNKAEQMLELYRDLAKAANAFNQPRYVFDDEWRGREEAQQLYRALADVRRMEMKPGRPPEGAKVMEDLCEMAILQEMQSMGMDAEVLAFGGFTAEVVRYLDYQPEMYLGVPVGSPVVVTVFRVSGSSMSRALASAVGAEPYDFATHALDPRKVNTQKLQEMVDSGVFDEEELASFMGLRDAGFQFIFRPNG